jgi:lipid-A-disaccharide synthase
LLVTVNGPGELMGWARPFVRAVYEREPGADVTLVFVPCSYATGRESATAQLMFPLAKVVEPKRYARFLMGRPTEGMERGPGGLQYLGGDLFHATTIAKRLGLRPMTYKFSHRPYARTFQRFFALDENNAQQFRTQGAPPDRVRVVGNLVPDSVLGTLTGPTPEPGVGNGVCLLPGSRPYELRSLLPFFLSAASEVAARYPELEYSVAISPFNTDDEVRASVRAPDPALGGIGGELIEEGAAILAGGMRFALDRSGGYHAMANARLVVTIPGTKCLEAAVLGRPTLCVLPTNRMDDVAMNGIATYLHHIPLVGRPLKTWIARNVERRFRFVAQPNIDAGRMIMGELRGILTPHDVAANACALLAKPDELRAMGEALVQIYARDVGAAARMAAQALDVASAAPAHAAAS